ncbi:hypothetical protein [Aporhodopirellula aestuarii]|uniref:Transmembrane protein n=1 Tax=Aporhodopirellula aestuarii TaxID=2950107 RepID=A0ABT0U6A2_9BACT|nr:hypothetical protein [Aporhodopirellula aestuarii]MCM2372455.1 hypothetical protein [Aporhodopirellula aestuarii]
MTLASETKRKTPDRPGATKNKSNRSSFSDALPPTLLRLPDLDPTDVERDPCDAEDEAAGEVATTPSSAVTSDDDFDSKSSGESRESITLASINTAANETLPVSGSFPAVTGSPKTAATPKSFAESLPNVPDEPAVADEPMMTVEPMVTVEPKIEPTTNKLERGDESSDSSLLEHVASRKALLVVLVLIAGFAVFMPRNEETASDPGADLIADADVTWSDDEVLSGIAESDVVSEPFMSLADRPRAAEHHRGPGSSAIATGRIGDPLANSQMIQQPASDNSPAISQPPIDHRLASMANVSQPGMPDFPGDDVSNPYGADMNAPVDQTPQFSSHRSTNTPDFDPSRLDAVSASLAAAANEEIRRMDAARAGLAQGAPVVSQPETSLGYPNEPVAAAKPEILKSRTPDAITNWTQYLPPLDAESFAAPVSPAQPTEAGVSTGTRMTNLPDEPDFGFALPGDTASGNPVGQEARATPARPEDSTVSPEARVAMPTYGYPRVDGLR